MSDSAGQAVVPCCHHPQQRATHNCMNCGQPLCIDCVRQNGYYCSRECKDIVRARTPSAAPDAAVNAVDEKLNRGLELGRAILEKLKRPALVLLVLLIGYGAWRIFGGPHGRVTASVPITSDVAAFHAQVLADDLVVCQANDELFLLKMSTQQKTWKIDLRSLELTTPPPAGAGGVDADGNVVPFRERLELAAIQAGQILLRSQRQVIALDRQGRVQWKYSQPDAFLAAITPHAAGLLCRVGGESPALVNVALADGTASWSTTNGIASYPPPLLAGNRLVLLSRQRPPPAAENRNDEEGEITAGPADEFSAQKLLGQAKGAAAPKKGVNYELQFISLANGQASEPTTIVFAGDPRPQQLGADLVVTAGPDVVLFGTGTAPVWTATLDAAVEHLAAGGGVLAAASAHTLVALEAKSGRQKWSRAGLAIGRLAVGPDGAVYATVSMAKDAAKDFRSAEIATSGRTPPNQPVPALLKLDAKTGRTVWGVKYIGDELVFAPQALYVVDRTEGMDLLANQGPFVSGYSVRRLSPRNGDDVWAYFTQGQMVAAELMGQKFLLAVLPNPPAGRRNPIGNYLLETVEGK